MKKFFGVIALLWLCLLPCGVSAQGSATENLQIAFFPGDGATGIPVQTKITLYFNQPVDPATVNVSTVNLWSDGKLIEGKLTHEFNRDGTSKVCFIPEHPLLASTEYKVFVSRELRDFAGRRLGKNVIWNFTTAPAGDDYAWIKSLVASGPKYLGAASFDQRVVWAEEWQGRFTLKLADFSSRETKILLTGQSAVIPLALGQNVVVCTDGEGCFALNILTWVQQSIPVRRHCWWGHQLQVDENKVLWMEDGDGVYIYDLVTGKLEVRKGELLQHPNFAPFD